jgi:hypothetical protein
MTVAPAKQASQLRASVFGPYVVSPAQVVPTGSTTLWTVSGGVVVITRVHIVVTTVFTGTATTLTMGCNVAGSPSAAALYSAATLTSLTVGTILDSTLAKITVGAPAFTGGVVATPGPITWIASAGNTGQCQVFLSYFPLDDNTTVG